MEASIIVDVGDAAGYDELVKKVFPSNDVQAVSFNPEEGTSTIAVQVAKLREVREVREWIEKLGFDVRDVT